jgi:mannose-6-phosphate isomerase
MKQAPAFKDYLWGGERLVADYGKRTDMRPVAESWELSCHPDGPSAVENGPFAGQTLERVLREHPDFAGAAFAPGGAAGASGAGASGSAGTPGADGAGNAHGASGAQGAAETGGPPGGAAGAFPVLVKLIDAKQNLSLQVHPDDAYARERENSLGKNEMWYVADCEPGASLILGFSRAMGRAEIVEAIENGSILDDVNVVPVSPGDCFCVPAGLIHAIGAGIVIAEIQQSSNITYRVYDYGRTGADGKPRPLHIGRAADVIDTGLSAKNSSRGAAPLRHKGYAETVLAGWRYFRVSRLDISAGADSPAELRCGEASFHGLLVIDGGLSLLWAAPGAACAARAAPEETMPLAKGDCVFVPAGMGAYGLSGAATALLVTL